MWFPCAATLGRPCVQRIGTNGAGAVGILPTQSGEIPDAPSRGPPKKTLAQSAWYSGRLSCTSRK